MNDCMMALKQQGIKLYLNTLYPVILKHRAQKVGKKETIEVVFFAVNIAMWRYQGVYDLLSKEKRFNCHIVLTVFETYSRDQQADDLKQLRAYFNENGIEYLDYDEVSGRGYDVSAMINPDILFYPQPYTTVYPSEHHFRLFDNKLLCYSVYGLYVAKDSPMVFDLRFHNMAWKIYCPTAIEKNNAAKLARNHGRNWLVSGYTNLDRYCASKYVDVWKSQQNHPKRLIWAPHFTIVNDLTFVKSRTSFLWMAQLMLDVSEKYKGQLQIAFKPHPRLKSELYKHPDWGKEKTDAYYERWANGENTQLETGGFVDLFMSSDAMIHDCGSFTAEYLYVNKPVAFVSADIAELKADHNELGSMSLDQHYIVKNRDDVIHFIEDVVIEGHDSMKAQRTSFYEKVLRPNVTGTTSQFIVEDIKRSLGITD